MAAPLTSVAHYSYRYSRHIILLLHYHRVTYYEGDDYNEFT
jgi:hypothetical protein